MSFRSAMLRVANTLRALPSKPGLDVRTTTLTIRTKTWTGGARGAEGGSSNADLVITPTPRARELNTTEITSSGGRYRTGDVLVDQITPDHANNSGIGYTVAQLAPVATTNGVQIIYLLAGDIAGEFSRIDLKRGVLGYELVLRLTRATP